MRDDGRPTGADNHPYPAIEGRKDRHVMLSEEVACGGTGYIPTAMAIVDATCDVWNRLKNETGRIGSLCSYPWISTFEP